MSFSDETYDILKWIAQDFLPAFGVLVAGIITLFGLPYGEQVLGFISLVDAFLGRLLRISSKNYQGDGTLVIDTTDEAKDIYRIELAHQPEHMAKKDKIILSVNNVE